VSRKISKLKQPFQDSVREVLRIAEIAGLPVLVTDTTRTLAEQKELVKKKLSFTLDSKHLKGEAVDIAFEVDGKLRYDDSFYSDLYDIVKPIPYIVWPYRDYKWFWDMPHFQYDPNKVDVHINIKSMFRDIWKRTPARGEELYFLKRIELGSIQENGYDISEKMKYWYNLVYPYGKYSWVGDLRWQYEKFKILRGD